MRIFVNCVLLQAVAAVLQKDTSAIVTLSSSGLDRPAKLDGKVIVNLPMSERNAPPLVPGTSGLSPS